MLVSGANAVPRYMLQRRRARICDRNRRTFKTTPAGGVPASTRSKCWRDRVSSPFKKNARASSRRTRTRSGRSISMVREGSNGFVQQRLPRRLGNIGLSRCLRRRNADQKQDVLTVRVVPRQRPQDCQRLVEPALLDQCTGLRNLGRAGGR